ncbi:hypothetical protein [Rhodopila sp.]|jgi:hypothetical protein|uniref:hypothetical protein n=1 Tax=Rhodopila sp. TaxID=2480087 RepID=UPI002CDFFCB9|nr:hypothetical protein [Rhodopila sp.]HVZ10350.1 hypothetical protein [Rhodopila sp.]
MTPITDPMKPPFTEAVRRVLAEMNDPRLTDDLLFLEAWEMRPSTNLGQALRASQIRRANPALVAEIGAELQRLTKPARQRA